MGYSNCEDWFQLEQMFGLAAHENACYECEEARAATEVRLEGALVRQA